MTEQEHTQPIGQTVPPVGMNVVVSSPPLYQIAVCETQPVTAEGLKAALERVEGFSVVSVVHTLTDAVNMVQLYSPNVLLIDKSPGTASVTEVILNIRERHPGTAVVVWASSFNEAEALRILQSGASGMLRKTAPIETITTCLRTVANGKTWMEESLVRDNWRQDRYSRLELTPREQQVLELVEQGLKNKDIGRTLGIRPGTVKIHLKHIFEKTGVRGRYGLAISGLKDRGLITLGTY